MAEDDPHRRPTAGPHAGGAGAAPDLDAPTGEPRTAPTHAPTDVPTRAEGGVRRVKLDEDYVGTTLDERYKVLSKLGEGGMGVVYLAMHIHIEKKVAIKVLAPDVARRKNLVARFAQEAKAASRIGQENIINITDFGETATGAAFFVMEHLEGRDLARELRAQTALPLERVVPIMMQVCRAVAAAHEAGIVHRDLKPDNIFLVAREDRPDFVKILDFGIAKVSVLHEGERLTQTGTIFGTAQYMSPEQARGDPTDERTDVYAAGCILYEMLTGDVPFKADSFMGILRRQMEDAPEPPSRRAPARVTAALDAVILKALEKERAARFQTMKELGQALCAATGDDFAAHWGGARPVTPAKKRQAAVAAASRAASRAGSSGLRATAALAVVAVAAVGIAGWLFWPAPRHPATMAATTPLVAVQPVAASPPAIAAASPTAAAPAATSQISIGSMPPGATVTRAGERLGRTPFVLALPRETAAFDVTLERRGFRDAQLHVEPDRDRDYVVPLVAIARRTPAAAPPAAAAPAAATPLPAKPPAERRAPSELKDVLGE